MRSKVLAAVLLATAIFGGVTGLAASLGVNPDTLGSGTQTVSSCDDEVATAFTYSGSSAMVTDVVVSGVADGSLVAGTGSCDATTVYVDLLGAGGVVLGSGSAAHAGDADADDDAVTVDVVDADPSLITSVRVTIT